KSQANYNSACGGAHPASYARKDGKQKPVVLLVGPVHGAEFEGIVGLGNLLHVAGTGEEYPKRPRQPLAGNVAHCPVLLIPRGNPDGRAGCRFDSWVGEELSTNEPVTMGVKLDGESYKWPAVKRVHPMRPNSVRSLGAYFNDEGI